MVRKFIFCLLTVLIAGLVWANPQIRPLTRDPYDQGGDYIDRKARQQEITSPSYHDLRESRTRGRRRELRRQKEEVNQDGPVVVKGGKFDIEKVTNFKVLRDDKVVEIRNPKTGKRVITVMKASALPEEDLNRVELEYELMELDRLAVEVEKHDEKPRTIRIDHSGMVSYPLIGEMEVKGKTVPEVEKMFVEKFKSYIHEPVVHIDVTQKSPYARILVVGAGFREYQGHEKVLDILGADYKPSVENIYDKVCVIRKQDDQTYRCIVIDMEYMFKYFDFEQNIPLRAGDIVHVKKMPPLFGYRFKYWWQQILSWMNEIDEMFSAVKSVHNFDLDEE